MHCAHKIRPTVLGETVNSAQKLLIHLQHYSANDQRKEMNPCNYYLWEAMKDGNYVKYSYTVKPALNGPFIKRNLS